MCEVVNLNSAPGNNNLCTQKAAISNQMVINIIVYNFTFKTFLLTTLANCSFSSKGSWTMIREIIFVKSYACLYRTIVLS